MSHISMDNLPRFKHYGRYVCDWACSEIHLFDNLTEARKFAKTWGRDCNIGWLSPVYRDGRNYKPSAREAQLQVAGSARVVDCRKGV